MGDVSDLPLIGQALGGGTIVLDLLLNSGDLVIGLLGFLLANLPTFAGVVGALSTLAPKVAWLPNGLLETASTALVIALLTRSVIKLGAKAIGVKA